MKAMIFAAGYGKRLMPLTKSRPKALVCIERGLCLLEIAIRRLKLFGFDDIVINVHYLGDKIISFLESKSNFGIRISISNEQNQLLDTGGGLKKAKALLKKDNDKPFLLYNVDILTELNLKDLYKHHLSCGNDTLATLAIQKRKTIRGLLFDKEYNLCGWQRTANDRLVAIDREASLFRFSGVHVVSVDIFDKISMDGVFSIIELYLSLAKQGFSIVGYDHSMDYCFDAGSYKDISSASLDKIELA